MSSFLPLSFYQKTFDHKLTFACKMLAQLTPVVNFTNIFCAAFALIIFCQKNKKAKLQLEKSFEKHFRMKKLLVKC